MDPQPASPAPAPAPPLPSPRPRALPRRRPRAEVRSTLAELATGRPPFASVYLDITAGVHREMAAGRLDEALRQALDLTPAQHEVLAAAARQHEPSADDAALAVLVDADGRHLIRTYPVPPRREVMELANLPYLTPLLWAEQTLIHHVVAMVDVGVLDALVVPRHGEPVATRYEVSDAFSAAATLRNLCLASRTRLVVLAAPAAELDGLAEHVRVALPLEVELEVVPSDDLDLDGEVLSAQVHRITATHAARSTVELLRLWRFHHSQSEAVTGLADSVAALNTGRAALLLVNDEPADERTGSFMASSALVVPAGAPAAGSAGTGEPLLTARFADVVVRSALVQGCPLAIVPTVDSLDEGIGLILRDRATIDGLAEILER